MVATVKNTLPKIGDVYVARGEVAAILPQVVPSVWTGGSVEVWGPETISSGSHVLFLDVCLMMDVCPQSRAQVILVKLFCMKLRRVLYVKTHWYHTPTPTYADYKTGAHSFFLQFVEMSTS